VASPAACTRSFSTRPVESKVARVSWMAGAFALGAGHGVTQRRDPREMAPSPARLSPGLAVERVLSLSTIDRAGPRSNRPALPLLLVARFESSTGEVLAEGRHVQHAGSRSGHLPPDPPGLRSPAEIRPRSADVRWSLPGLAGIEEGTEGVLVLDDDERIEVRLIDGRLHQR
jgi:hypothetical protein